MYNTKTVTPEIARKRINTNKPIYNMKSSPIKAVNSVSLILLILTPSNFGRRLNEMISVSEAIPKKIVR
jgi:hypothetical protein